MATIGAAISLRNIEHEEWHYPFNLASGITTADIGKAVALDATAANRVKLVGDNDVVLGRLVSVENRVVEGILVGTVALKGAYKLPAVGGSAIAIGSSVVGSATAGSVKAAGAANNTVVVESEVGSVIVIVK